MHQHGDTTIYLVRHGVTVNPLRRIKGTLPGFPLSSIGKEQVQEAAEYLRAARPMAIFASPVERSVQTAAILSGHFPHATLSTTFELTEWEFPRWEGLSITDVQERYPEEWRIYHTRPSILNDPNGETLGAAQKRMSGFITRTQHRFTGEEVILCSHGDPILTAHAYFSHVPLDRFKTLPCHPGSVTTFTFGPTSDWPEISYWQPFTAVEEEGDKESR